MPRSLPIGNGNLLVTFDQRGLMHDFYFPYVGLEDHTTFGHYHRIGIYDVEQKSYTWLTEDHWQSEAQYQEETLIGNTVLHSDQWQLKLKFVDFVHPIENFLCRRLQIENLADRERELRVFFNFDFHMYGTKGNDTVYFTPEGNQMIFYKYNRYFLIDGRSETGGIEQYSTGKSEYNGLEGTWRDAEDGELSGHPIEQGSVDGTVGFHCKAPANGITKVDHWICVGENLIEVQRLNRKVLGIGVDEYQDYTTRYWRSWVNKQDYNFNGIPEEMQKLFKHSLLIIRTQIDNRGAIIAANDTDIMKFNKDTYSYMWPRDASLIANTLDNTGYTEITKRYFRFLAKVQAPEGYLLHKFNPDGSIGSSWHPWIYNDKYQIPLQEDETALPLIALHNHYQRVHDIEFIQEMYDKFVVDAAEFLYRYVDTETGLPLPSYDPWEEQKGTFSYTCATVYSGLVAASELSRIVGHDQHAEKYLQRAITVKQAILDHLYCPEQQCFVKKLTIAGEKDYTADASVAMIFILGVLPADDERVVKTMRRLKEKLLVPTDVSGLARYENDYYQRTGEYPSEIPGNPWIITTLWYAQWLMEIASSADSEELKEAEHWLWWATNLASSTHVLAEQYSPLNADPLSVAPLTWSHATYVDAVMRYRKRLRDFGICDTCMLPGLEA